jgi:hypothetical protein
MSFLISISPFSRLAQENICFFLEGVSLNLFKFHDTIRVQWHKERNIQRHIKTLLNNRANITNNGLFSSAPDTISFSSNHPRHGAHDALWHSAY